MTFWRGVLWLLCAEGLLIWRGGLLSPGMTLFFLALLGVKAFAIGGRVPVFEEQVIFLILIPFLIGGLWLMGAFKAMRRRMREHFGAPVTGFNVLARFFGMRPRRNAFLEFILEPLSLLLVGAFVIVHSTKFVNVPGGTVYDPSGLPLGLQHWLAAHAWDVAFTMAVLPGVALLLHNIFDWRCGRTHVRRSDDLGDDEKFFPDAQPGRVGAPSPDVRGMGRRFRPS